MGRRFRVDRCLADGRFIFLRGAKAEDLPDQVEGTGADDQTIRAIPASDLETPYVGQCDRDHSGSVPCLVDDSR